MSKQHSTDSSMTPIKVSIESIDIKGQYIQLAAPIHLSGRLNVSELLTQYSVDRQQDLTQPMLQIGIDEAGRGPLLGSVNVAAAILPAAWSGLIEEQPLTGTPLSILTDSKQLSEKKRDILYPLVKQYAIGYVIADIPAAVIDQVNILQATMLGMRLCTETLIEVVAQQFAMAHEIEADAAKPLQVEVLFDGNRCPELDFAKLTKCGDEQANIDCQAWVKGDARHTSIAAGSILAKVSRDEAMYALDTQYPEYGIAKHKGYPTRAHMEAIETYGVLSEHRRSFAPVRKALES
ncbi:ribonuclease HII [Psychrobacter sp. SCQQ22]|uniref:ribonuclease HII n=1 Tax=Psychrobacter sp. SCQQ22 TaxID=2792059 RepID=UPI0018CFBB4C|nr:ribonuclease HII [Psychrobacter sp. SCQQ22]MBH0086247.1 ribonuclease HII [Psychrobacter sp. SCQQ22]